MGIGSGRLLHLTLSYNFIISRGLSLSTNPKYPRAREPKSILRVDPFQYEDIETMAEGEAMTTNEPHAYVFVKVLPGDESDGSSRTNEDDEFLVKLVPTRDANDDLATRERPTSDAPDNAQERDIIPIFSMADHDALINIYGNAVDGSSISIPTMKRLFAFPMQDGDESIGDKPNKVLHSDGSNLSSSGVSNDRGGGTPMALIFESSLSVNHGDLVNDPSYKVMRMKELFKLIENRQSRSDQKHRHPNTIHSSLTKHILHLRRQYRLDSLVPGRRLLRGTSGSNIDDYTLRPKPAVVFFDCDDCLYFDDWKIAGHLTAKIENHCQKEFGLPKGHAYALYKKHGTALRGLIAEGHLSGDCAASTDGFLDEVHDLPIRELLSPDRKLRDMISSIDPSVRKFVFTASVSHHARRCLEALGIADLMEGIIDVKDCRFETKHSMSSFRIAMEKAGIDDPEACVFLDDSVKNIEAARKVGWRSVLVGRVGRDCGGPVTSEHAEHEIDRIHHLPEVFPELFLE